MTKKKRFIIFLIFFFIFNINIVSAKASTGIYLLTDSCVVDGEGCESLFGDPNCSTSVAHYLQEIFTTIKWLAPLLCIVFSVIEFTKALTSQDKEAVNKAFARTVKRLIAGLILFFLPSLINFLFPLLGWYGTCGIG